MARNFVQPGKTLTLTAPSGGVVTGLGYLIGAIFVVAMRTVAETLGFEGATEGVWTLPKTSAQAWTEGLRIYWDDTNHRCDSDGTKGPLIGIAAAVAANPSSTGDVRLNGISPGLLEGPEGAVADLVDNSGGAAADGTIAVVTAPTALTDNGAGTADGTVQAMSDIATAGGATPTAAQVDTAVNAALLAIRNNFKEVTTTQTANRTAIVALTDAVKELAAKQNALLAQLRLNGVILP